MKVIPLKTNQWYLLNGPEEIRKKVIKLLMDDGWECPATLSSMGPACIRLMVDGGIHRIHYRMIYNNRYMTNVIIVDCYELLLQMSGQKVKEENMSGSLNQPECHHYNKILEMAHNRKRQVLEDDYNNVVDAIHKDNVYMAAISNAIAKVNKVTGLELRIDGTWCNYKVLLLPSDKLRIEKAQEAYQKALAKLNSEYEVAETLLGMADTFQEQLAILEKYAKEVL